MKYLQAITEYKIPCYFCFMYTLFIPKSIQNQYNFHLFLPDLKCFQNRIQTGYPLP